MTLIDAIALFTVLVLPPLACRKGYKKGILEERERHNLLKHMHVNYCQCGLQKRENG